MKIKCPVFCSSLLIASSALLTTQAANQFWNDASPDNIWNLSNANWDSGSTWSNGNSANFAGTGEIVEIGAAITTDYLNFSVNSYEIADANKDGSLTLVGSPSIAVAAGCTGKLSVAVSGAAGLTKEGAGTLEFKAVNTYSGITHVQAGILKLAYQLPGSLGATDVGNETIVESGAALDLNGSYTANRADDITVSGTGVNGSGAIFTSAFSGTYNVGFRNLTLAGDTTISVPFRWDLGGSGSFTGNGYTLTKIGDNEIAVSRALNNCPININGGALTIQHLEALGGSDYDTVVNNATLGIWGNHTISERIFFIGANAALKEGQDNLTATFSGHLTVSNTLNFISNSKSSINVAGYIDGQGESASRALEHATSQARPTHTLARP